MPGSMIFAVTAFLSAALSFAIEPMLGKALLPALGGGSTIWTTVMLWFQCGMLAGYAGVHAARQYIGEARTGLLLVGLALLGAVVVPAIPAVTTASFGPVLAVLVTLSAGYGTAVVAMAGNSPSLQLWLLRRSGREPYHLYAISNAGSLTGLLAYPFLIEPNLSVSQQAWAWRVGYGVLVLCMAFCLAVAWKSLQAASPSSANVVPAPRWRRRGLWIALSALPSSLLLGVTQHLTVDVAPFPLLWVLPLAIYLLTFIVAFAAPAATVRRGVLWRSAAIPLLMLLALQPSVGLSAPGVDIGANLAAFAAIALLCHGKLAGTRPDAHRLTDFYMCMSIGGALGGIANALVAPMVLDRLAEYPLALAIGCLIGTSASLNGRRHLLGGVAAAGFVGVLLFTAWQGAGLGAFGLGRMVIILGIGAAWFIAMRSRSWAMGAGALACLVGPLYLLPASEGREVLSSRDFYGPLTVVEKAGQLLLKDGTTTHGIEWLDPAKAAEPLAYYHRNSGIGRLFALLDAARSQRGTGTDVLAIGLGTGAIACYGSALTHISFVELDPGVVPVAENTFHYLSSCGHPPIAIADGRLAIEHRPDHSLDLLIVDAFSSDAVPAHLLTAEAFGQYLRVLRPGGIVAMHVSNRYLDLPPVVAGAARSNGANSYRFDAPADQTEGVPSTWTAVTRDQAMAEMLSSSGWTAMDSGPSRTWTDGKWDLMSSIRWH